MNNPTEIIEIINLVMNIDVNTTFLYMLIFEFDGIVTSLNFVIREDVCLQIMICNNSSTSYLTLYQIKESEP